MGEKGEELASRIRCAVFIAELARRVGRSTDTIKAWEEQGLLTPARDEQDRRIYSEDDVRVGLKLAALGITARRRSKKLAELVAAEPVQLSLIRNDAKERHARKAPKVSAAVGARHGS